MTKITSSYATWPLTYIVVPALSKKLRILKSSNAFEVIDDFSFEILGRYIDTVGKCQRNVLGKIDL